LEILTQKEREKEVNTDCHRGHTVAIHSDDDDGDDDANDNNHTGNCLGLKTEGISLIEYAQWILDIKRFDIK